MTGGLASLPMAGVTIAVALVATSSEVVLGGVGAYYCHKQQHNTQSQRLINSMEAFSFWFQRRGYEPKIESDRVERANSLTQS
jgi:hypothetical protein